MSGGQFGDGGEADAGDTEVVLSEIPNGKVHTLGGFRSERA